jgi:hypothetical protein
VTKSVQREVDSLSMAGCDTLLQKKIESISAMKRSFLSKLHTNGLYYLISALLLVAGVPLYQFVVLLPQGYSDALASADQGAFTPYLIWVENHTGQFLGYRALLVIAFAALISLPFTLFRIIVAQEILGHEEEDNEEDGMPANAWRGKGFAVVAAWSGLVGIMLYTLGTLASTTYLFVVSNSFTPHTAIPDNFSAILDILAVVTNTIGIGLLALSCLFFGAMIARSGRNLWPGIWVAFGYTALAIAALLSASAVAVASTPAGQTPLTTPATLLFALWVLWFGIMLVRLKPEP